MRKLNISIIVGVIIALIGASLVFFYGRHVSNKISDGKATQSVLVANEPLAAGSTASQIAAHVHVTQIPSAYVVTGALTTMDQLTSTAAQNFALVGAVAKGGQLSSANFAQGAAAGVVQPSKGNVAIAVTLPLNAGVARYLQPNQKVDLFVTYTQSNQTKLFATGVRVLSVNIADTKGTNGDTSSSETPSGQVLVLLDASPLIAQKIVNAVSLGTPYLAYAPTGGTTAKATTPQNVLNSR